MDKQINHDKFHDESKTGTHILSKLPDDGDPWAPNNLLTPEQKKTTSRDQCFLDFIEYNNMVSLSSLDIRTGPISTFVSFDGKSESHIDHILMPYEKSDLISSCDIPDDSSLNVSSHRPILCSFQLPHVLSCLNTQITDVINWSKVRQEDKYLYTESLQTSAVLNDALSEEIKSVADIDNMYNQLVSSLNYAAKTHNPRSRFKPHLKPYWNKDLTEAHK